MRDRSDIFNGTPIKIQEQYRHGIQQMPLALHSSEIPIIAAVNGAAIGAGFDLACMCDIRIASTRAQVSEAFINFALAGALGIGGDDPEEEFYKWAEEGFGGGSFARHCVWTLKFAGEKRRYVDDWRVKNFYRVNFWNRIEGKTLAEISPEVA